MGASDVSDDETIQNHSADPGRKAMWSWCFYDWANSAFATSVLAVFFPLFFTQYWSAGVDTTLCTARLGIANSIAGLLIAVFAPLLGAIADMGGYRKRFLVFFAYTGSAMTCALVFIAQGQWIMAACFFIGANIGFSGGNIFYDSLITAVARHKRLHSVSSLGFAMGYLGGGLLFFINVVAVLRPGMFGFASSSEAVPYTFLSTGLWWGVFTLPLVKFVREPKYRENKPAYHAFRNGLRELRSTFHEIWHSKHLRIFLIAYWLYIDGVDTIIRMAVDYGLSLGFEQKDLIIALLITQFVGFPSAILFGKLGNIWGAKRSIMAALAIYVLVSFWGSIMKTVNEFYVMAILIGLVQGGIQALSRSYFARMIPPEKSAEYFGFYNMLGKFAVIIGPGLMGSTAVILHSAGIASNHATRLSILSVACLFVIGGYLLGKLPETR
ncbi:MFS transporter [bacterium]|nr:MFS transporter [candidate division CSSED10-310 bacterium]